MILTLIRGLEKDKKIINLKTFLALRMLRHHNYQIWSENLKKISCLYLIDLCTQAWAKTFLISMYKLTFLLHFSIY